MNKLIVRPKSVKSIFRYFPEFGLLILMTSKVVVSLIVLSRDGQRNGTRRMSREYWPFRSGKTGTGTENVNSFHRMSTRNEK